MVTKLKIKISFFLNQQYNMYIIGNNDNHHKGGELMKTIYQVGYGQRKEQEVFIDAVQKWLGGAAA